LLYSVSQKISLSVESTEVLNSIIDSLNMVVPYDAAAIFLLDARTLDVAEETMRGYPPGSEGSLQLKLGEGIVGWAAKTGQSVIVPDVRTDPRYVRARPQTRAEMVAPLKTGGEVIGVFNLESDRVNAYTPHELRLLETFANHAAVGIERSRLLRQQLEKERLDRELKFARRIQLSFLPERDPDWTGYDVSAANISSEEVSGDFYDFIPISRDNWGVVIADVSGKGVPAALIMASLRAALWAEVRNTYALATICARMNNFLYQSLGDYEFVTAVYGVLDLDSHIFTYTNAGHLPPLHVRPDGAVSFLEEGGLILGAFRDADTPRAGLAGPGRAPGLLHGWSRRGHERRRRRVRAGSTRGSRPGDPEPERSRHTRGDCGPRTFFQRAGSPGRRSHSDHPEARPDRAPQGLREEVGADCKSK
jgi:sigma-B regulation protein RsbU (phosphoserine phosphatase)